MRRRQFDARVEVRCDKGRLVRRIAIPGEVLGRGEAAARERYGRVLNDSASDRGEFGRADGSCRWEARWKRRVELLHIEWLAVVHSRVATRDQDRDPANAKLFKLDIECLGVTRLNNAADAAVDSLAIRDRPHQRSVGIGQHGRRPSSQVEVVPGVQIEVGRDPRARGDDVLDVELGLGSRRLVAVRAAGQVAHLLGWEVVLFLKLGEVAREVPLALELGDRH
mmetsp:Transcript_14466/g.37218  ORF Transcript_14466/g.37218 Transcript_14466/m.37218 type:complete len:223 (-) Transcript_14466:648-1316(-)